MVYVQAENLQGLSPRLRGNRLSLMRLRFKVRSIPAPAGKPARRQALPPGDTVYPRACGETTLTEFLSAPVDGLSPRLRGNRQGGRLDDVGHGSIPAPAGKPKSCIHWCVGSAVYPRACGETSTDPTNNVIGAGLSPRLRGNPLRHHSEYLPMRL